VKIFSSILIFVGTSILLLIYWPVIKEELKYSFDQMTHVRYSLDTEVEGSFDKPLVVPNTDFSIAIPKIAAVAPVISDVDPLNKIEYLRALREGVAHEKELHIRERRVMYTFLPIQQTLSIM